MRVIDEVMTTSEAAERWGLSIETVKKHVRDREDYRRDFSRMNLGNPGAHGW